MMMGLEVKDIKAILAEGLRLYREKDPARHSFNYIARKTNNSASFVERAAKNSLGDALDSKKVLALSEVVLGHGENERFVQFFLQKFLTEESDILKDAISAKFVNQFQSEATKEIDDICEHEETFIAYILSSSGAGVSREDLINVGGKKILNGVRKIEEMNLIEFKGGYYRARKLNFSLSSQGLMRSIVHLFKFYNPFNIGKKLNFIHVLTNSLSKVGIEKWQDEHRRHHEELSRIGEENQGNYHVFSFGAMDVILKSLPKRS